jgi:quercetin dioxygenase-like cupin family protein
MTSLIVRPGDIEPFDRGNGVTTLPRVGQWNSKDTTVTTGITAFEPGTGLPLHTHNVEECVLVLEGEATVTIADQTTTVPPGTATWVPAGTPHRFANHTDQPMRIYWVYGGRKVTRTTVATGETVEHLSNADRTGTTEH